MVIKVSKTEAGGHAKIVAVIGVSDGDFEQGRSSGNGEPTWV